MMKNGFTISELIITTIAIGVLAGLTIPTLIHNIKLQTHQRTRLLQQQKIAQGITMLSVRSPRMGYTSTKAFVEDLRKHMQIMEYCCNDVSSKCKAHIEGCWPSEKIILNDGKEYTIANAYTNKGANGNVFRMDDGVDPDGIEADYADDNVSFVTNNGIAVLINYNKECHPNASNENRSCYVALVDVNGDKGPNKVGEDLYLINANGFINQMRNKNSETAGAAGARARREMDDDVDGMW